MPSQNPECVFCQISEGLIPSLNILETEQALAFLDVGPLADGHVLLIPRSHFATLEQMPAELVADVTSLLPQLSRAVLKVSGAAGFNVLQNNGRLAGQFVDHVHFHIIPRAEDDGLGYRWNARRYESGRGEALQQQLIRAHEESRRDH